MRPPLGGDSLGLEVAESPEMTSMSRGARLEEDRHRRLNEPRKLLRPLLSTLLPAGLLAPALLGLGLLEPSSCSESVRITKDGLPTGEGGRCRAVTE